MPSYPELRWLTLATSAGQSAATAAGILAARGDWIATLDADLQNDPADLVHLWNALPGHDAALGWRMIAAGCCLQTRDQHSGQTGFETSCLDSQFATRAVRSGSFLGRLALRLPMFHGMHRFIGPLLLREGCKLIQVPVNHRPRTSGRITLQPLESFALRDHRPARCYLALAAAGALSSDPEAAIGNRSCSCSIRIHGFSRSPRIPRGLSRVEPGHLADGGISGSGALHRAVSGAVVGLRDESASRSFPLHSGGSVFWGVSRFSRMRFSAVTR